MSYQTVTLSDCQTLLAQRYENQPYWTADQARRALNEGLRVWSLITATWRTSIDLLTIPNDPHLYVGGTMVKATQVRIGSRVLTPTSLYALDRSIASWESKNTESGLPTPTQVVYWAPIGITEIMIYPADAPPGQTAITVDGVRSTPILVNAGDFLDLGEEELSVLLGYALHVLSFAKGIEALMASRPLYLAFLRAAVARNAVFAASSFLRKMNGWDMNRGARPVPDEASSVVAGETLVSSVVEGS